MSVDPLAPLLAAIGAGNLPSPAGTDRWAVFNAQSAERLAVWRSELACEQGFRPIFLDLEKRGFKVQPVLEERQEFDHAIVIAGRSREMNENNIARAGLLVRAGGLLMVTGDKKNGLQSLRKRTGVAVPIDGSISKSHGICFWFRNNPGIQVFPVAGRVTAGNLFAGGKTDRGSVLLASQFRNRLHGHVADLGAGWGYLSDQAIRSCETIDSLDLYEADFGSLEAARQLLAETPVNCHFHWHDIASERVADRFDRVIMNPPVHHGHSGERQTDIGLGRAFIRAAATMLKPRGHLLMVANRKLPYEAEISRLFTRHKVILEAEGYKVIECLR